MPEAPPYALRFHRSIYGIEAVRRAAGRFAELAEIGVVENDVDVLVAVNPVRPELGERLLDELANHALFEATRDRRVAC